MAAVVRSDSGLISLKVRLQGGVSPAARQNQDIRDHAALGGGWPASDLAGLAGIRGQNWNAAASSKVIGAVAQHMRAERAFLTTVLFAPGTVLDSLLKQSPKGAAGSWSAGHDIDAWVAMCLTCEAAWDTVSKGEFDDPSYAVGDAELLRPIAARVRFLVLAEPMRWRGETKGTCWERPADRDYGQNGVLSRVLGIESWHLLVSRCIEARRTWLDYLNAYQSHPLLSQAEPGDLEEDLAALIFRHPGPALSARASAPLGLSGKRLAEPAALTAGDKAVISETADQHLLPRFALPAMVRLAFPGDSFKKHHAVYAMTTVIAGLAAVGLSAALFIYQATIAAAAFYLLVCAGCVVMGSNWSGVWLLRMPAASAVGIIALVSFLPGDWLQGPDDGWLAVLTLGSVSYGYLVVEARNHGVADWASVRRALAVASLGAVHALMVSLIGLVIVAPAFVSSGPAVASLWRHPGYRHAGLELALATAWCLAVGVFSQILWDDRPITAQLAHLSWRSK